VKVLEKKNAGTVKGQAGHGKRLKTKWDGKNVPFAAEKGLTAA
jgi:hypothetical protein